MPEHVRSDTLTVILYISIQTRSKAVESVYLHYIHIKPTDARFLQIGHISPYARGEILCRPVLSVQTSAQVHILARASFVAYSLSNSSAVTQTTS